MEKQEERCIWGQTHDYQVSGFFLNPILDFITSEIRCLFSGWSCCSVAQSCSNLCNHMDCSTPGLPVHHQLPELAQTHVHWVSDAIKLSHTLSPPSPPTFSLSQHQGLFRWVSSSYLMTRVLELQLQHQSFQWIFRTDFRIESEYYNFVFQLP